MTSPLVSTRDRKAQGLGLACHRPVDGAKAKLPEGTIVVSADNHWGLAEDPWKGRVPEHLADRMPSVWWDEERQMWNMGFAGEPLFTDQVARFLKAVEDRPGTSRIEERLRDLDAEGIAMELVFPQTLLMFFKFPDFEVREWLFRAYNEYLAEVGARAPGRFFGVGFINFWDPDKVEESIRHLKGCGLKAICIPINPGEDIHGQPIHYASGKMDILWATAAALGLPIYFHVGETLQFDAPGGVLGNFFEIFAPFRRNFAQLVFGGVFDRHPDLRVIFAEAGLHWIPGVLQDAELMMDQFEDLLDPKIAMRPTDYWRRNCYATFMADTLGLKLIDYIGADRVMWSADYPHIESTLGITRAVLEEILASVSEADAKKILGGNAIELFDLV